MTDESKYTVMSRFYKGLGNFRHLALASVLALLGLVIYKVMKGVRRQYYKSKLATLPYSSYQDRSYYEKCLLEMS